MTDTSLSPDTSPFYDIGSCHSGPHFGCARGQIIAPMPGSTSLAVHDCQGPITSPIWTEARHLSGMTVTPLDCAGCGEMLYIAWETSA